MAAFLLAQEGKAMGWIERSIRSPSYGQAVIVSDGVSVGVWRFRGFWPDHNGNGCSGESSSTTLLNEITHWMPLPAAPSE